MQFFNIKHDARTSDAMAVMKWARLWHCLHLVYTKILEFKVKIELQTYWNLHQRNGTGTPEI